MDPHSEYRKLIQKTLFSLCTLVGRIWDISQENSGDGAYNRNALESAFRLHWGNIEILCNVPEEMEIACKDKDNVTLSKEKIPIEYKAKFQSIRYLEKPNTHRLKEYIIEQLQGWSHPIWMGELSLERAAVVYYTAEMFWRSLETSRSCRSCQRFSIRLV